MRPSWSNVIFLLFAFCSGSAAQQTRFLAFQENVVEVSPENKLWQVKLPTLVLQASILGTTAPTVSADQRWVAFVRDQDLWLYQTSSRQIRRATKVGRAYTKTFASIEVLIVAWSRDSGRILIRTEPGETECVDCEDRGDWKIRKADYGYFVYKVQERRIEKVSVPELEIAGWLDDDWLLGTTTTMPSSMVVTKLDGTTRVFGADITPRTAHQLRIAPNAESVYASLTRGDKSSQIVRISPKSGQVMPLSEVGSYAEFQWPSSSPSDRQVAWTQRSGDVPNPSARLVVNGKPVFSCGAATLLFEWVDEARLAALCGDRVVLLDASSGKEMASVVLTASPR